MTRLQFIAKLLLEALEKPAADSPAEVAHGARVELRDATQPRHDGEEDAKRRSRAHVARPKKTKARR